MVCLLQKQFNHRENTISIDQQDILRDKFKLLTDENKETKVGIEAHDYDELRDGIGDQLTVAHFLAFVIDGLVEGTVSKDVPKPVTYFEYHDLCTSKLNSLENALFVEKNIESAQKAMDAYISALYSIPETAKFDVDADLLEITISSLGKICETKELAERTLSAYQERGYVVHIEQSESGFVIIVSEKCIVSEKVIPKGKFLKSLEYIEVSLAETDEAPNWGTTH